MSRDKTGESQVRQRKHSGEKPGTKRQKKKKQICRWRKTKETRETEEIQTNAAAGTRTTKREKKTKRQGGRIKHNTNAPSFAVVSRTSWSESCSSFVVERSWALGGVRAGGVLLCLSWFVASLFLLFGFLLSFFFLECLVLGLLRACPGLVASGCLKIKGLLIWWRLSTMRREKREKREKKRGEWCGGQDGLRSGRPRSSASPQSGCCRTARSRASCGRRRR